MEAPGRVELPTNGLGNRCSIHLSYGAMELILLNSAGQGPGRSSPACCPATDECARPHY